MTRERMPDYPPEYDLPDESEYEHTVGSLAGELGLGATLAEAARAYDRHGVVTLGVEVAGGGWHYGPEAIAKLGDATPITCASISGIAWDGSDWEDTQTCEPTKEGVEAALQAHEDALQEYLAEREAEEDDDA